MFLGVYLWEPGHERISSKVLGFFVSFIDLYVLWMTSSLA
jgi:hypothetical protein